MATLGLGLAALGRPGYINLGHARDLGDDRGQGALERRAHAVLDTAFEGGVRYFDAARSYGLAEAFLASWLATRALAPGAVTVASKWGYTYTAGWRVDVPVHEVKDHTLPALRRQLAESRATLGAYLDLYQIHSATLESGVLDDADVIDALAALRNEGLRIGLTTSGRAQADTIWRALEVRRDGARVFDAVQATWNLLERTVEPALRAAHDAGVRVIVKEVLANGRLTTRNGSGPSAPRAAIVAAEAERLGVTTDALALAAALTRPWANVVLSGAVTVEQLRSNLGARTVTLPAESWERRAGLAMDSAEYWRERSELPWN
jgi:aryl-alcohol dehydrogenase-like predicted oxidoreductase